MAQPAHLELRVDSSEVDVVSRFAAQTALHSSSDWVRTIEDPLGEVLWGPDTCGETPISLARLCNAKSSRKPSFGLLTRPKPTSFSRFTATCAQLGISQNVGRDIINALPEGFITETDENPEKSNNKDPKLSIGSLQFADVAAVQGDCSQSRLSSGQRHMPAIAIKAAETAFISSSRLSVSPVVPNSFPSPGLPAAPQLNTSSLADTHWEKRQEKGPQNWHPRQLYHAKRKESALPSKRLAHQPSGSRSQSPQLSPLSCSPSSGSVFSDVPTDSDDEPPQRLENSSRSERRTNETGGNFDDFPPQQLQSNLDEDAPVDESVEREREAGSPALSDVSIEVSGVRSEWDDPAIMKGKVLDADVFVSEIADATHSATSDAGDEPESYRPDGADDVTESSETEAPDALTANSRGVPFSLGDATISLPVKHPSVDEPEVDEAEKAQCQESRYSPLLSPGRCAKALEAVPSTKGSAKRILKECQPLKFVARRRGPSSGKKMPLEKPSSLSLVEKPAKTVCLARDVTKPKFVRLTKKASKSRDVSLKRKVAKSQPSSSKFKRICSPSSPGSDRSASPEISYPVANENASRTLEPADNVVVSLAKDADTAKLDVCRAPAAEPVKRIISDELATEAQPGDGLQEVVSDFSVTDKATAELRASDDAGDLIKELRDLADLAADLPDDFDIATEEDGGSESNEDLLETNDVLNTDKNELVTFDDMKRILRETDPEGIDWDRELREKETYSPRVTPDRSSIANEAVSSETKKAATAEPPSPKKTETRAESVIPSTKLKPPGLRVEINVGDNNECSVRKVRHSASPQLLTLTRTLSSSSAGNRSPCEKRAKKEKWPSRNSFERRRSRDRLRSPDHSSPRSKDSLGSFRAKRKRSLSPRRGLSGFGRERRRSRSPLRKSRRRSRSQPRRQWRRRTSKSSSREREDSREKETKKRRDEKQKVEWSEETGDAMKRIGAEREESLEEREREEERIRNEREQNRDFAAAMARNSRFSSGGSSKSVSPSRREEPLPENSEKIDSPVQEVVTPAPPQKVTCQRLTGGVLELPSDLPLSVVERAIRHPFHDIFRDGRTTKLVKTHWHPQMRISLFQPDEIEDLMRNQAAHVFKAARQREQWEKLGDSQPFPPPTPPEHPRFRDRRAYATYTDEEYRDLYLSDQEEERKKSDDLDRVHWQHKRIELLVHFDTRKYEIESRRYRNAKVNDIAVMTCNFKDVLLNNGRSRYGDEAWRKNECLRGLASRHTAPMPVNALSMWVLEQHDARMMTQAEMESGQLSYRYFDKHDRRGPPYSDTGFNCFLRDLPTCDGPLKAKVGEIYKRYLSLIPTAMPEKVSKLVFHDYDHSVPRPIGHWSQDFGHPMVTNVTPPPGMALSPLVPQDEPRKPSTRFSSTPPVHTAKEREDLWDSVYVHDEAELNPDPNQQQGQPNAMGVHSLVPMHPQGNFLPQIPPWGTAMPPPVGYMPGQFWHFNNQPFCAPPHPRHPLLPRPTHIVPQFNMQLPPH